MSYEHGQQDGDCGCCFKVVPILLRFLLLFDSTTCHMSIHNQVTDQLNPKFEGFYSPLKFIFRTKIIISLNFSSKVLPYFSYLYIMMFLTIFMKLYALGFLLIFLFIISLACKIK